MSILDIRLLILVSVLFVALACSIIVFFDIVHERHKQENIKYKLLLYLGSHCLTQFCYTLYFYQVELLIWMNWLFLLVIVVVPVALYALIFRITSIDPGEKFPRYHYYAPLGLSLVLMVLSIVVPHSDQLKTLTGNAQYVGGSFLFYIFSRKLIFRFLFNAIYIVLTIRRLSPYKQFIKDYSANEMKSSLKWVRILIGIMASIMIVPLFGIFMTRTELAQSGVAYFQSALVIIQLCYLTYHILKKDYIVVEYSKRVVRNESLTQGSENVLQKKSMLNREMFDDYMQKEKPYLKPNIKIIDISDDLGINRTYVSAFINQEYQMNFSTYINTQRWKRYTALRSSAQNSHLSNPELAEMAGYGSYRNCLRFEEMMRETSSM